MAEVGNPQGRGKNLSTVTFCRFGQVMQVVISELLFSLIISYMYDVSICSHREDEEQSQGRGSQP